MWDFDRWKSCLKPLVQSVAVILRLIIEMLSRTCTGRCTVSLLHRWSAHVWSEAVFSAEKSSLFSLYYLENPPLQQRTVKVKIFKLLQETGGSSRSFFSTQKYSQFTRNLPVTLYSLFCRYVYNFRMHVDGHQWMWRCFLKHLIEADHCANKRIQKLSVSRYENDM